MTRITASLLQWLFQNIKATVWVSRGKALRLSNLELFTATDPMHPTLQQSHSRMTDRLIRVAAPANWTAIDDVCEMVTCILDPTYLITELS
ncbi:MAG: hypothetical protein SVX38_09365, partial [Chloroflexota bacterium]|nr:hypothetical protein [Chloroflexota bacterium]